MPVLEGLLGGGGGRARLETVSIGIIDNSKGAQERLNGVTGRKALEGLPLSWVWWDPGGK